MFDGQGDLVVGLGTTISSFTLTTGANKRHFLAAAYDAAENESYVIDFVKGY